MNSNTLFINSIKKSSQLINYQTVRWRRPKKPFWLGIAKSKRFIIPQPRVTRTPEEKAQNLILNSNYHIEMNALMNFVRNTDPKLKDSLFFTDQEGKLKSGSALEEEISKSFENNAAWNAESARRRNERLKKEKEEAMEVALKIVEIEEEKKKKKMKIIEEVVRKEKQLSGSYITRENIDEAIESCLSNVENFDFAIDLNGNIFRGSKSLPRVKEAESATAKTA